jgi:hypothetical protein
MIDDDDDDKVPAPLVTAPADRVGLPGVTSNLTTYRYHGPKYTEREEADDIRAAQDGDAAAEDRLVRHHQPMTGEIISKYFGLSYEDKIADGNPTTGASVGPPGCRGTAMGRPVGLSPEASGYDNDPS